MKTVGKKKSSRVFMKDGKAVLEVYTDAEFSTKAEVNVQIQNSTTELNQQIMVYNDMYDSIEQLKKEIADLEEIKKKMKD